MMQQYYQWEEQEEEEDEPMAYQVPLHLAERNLLSCNNAFKRRDGTNDTLVIFTKKENNDCRDIVLFPSPQKIEVLEKNRECTDDETPEILKTIQKIARRATVLAKREAAVTEKASSAQTSAASGISSKEQQIKNHGNVTMNSTPETNTLPELIGYSDSYDWDHYHHLGPHFTFSRARHNRRMARLAELPEFGEAPLANINLPFQMNEYELFDHIDGS